VAEQFNRIGERLPEIRQTLEDAARVIGSLGSPIADLQALLAGQPELQRQLDSARATSESERSQMLLAMSGDLAQKVGIAAQQFAQVGGLADKLATSASYLPTSAQYAALLAFHSWSHEGQRDELTNLSLLATLHEARKADGRGRFANTTPSSPARKGTTHPRKLALRARTGT
jgi:hypothetical protein